jgi:glutaredoxin/glutathione-dependent peroxiredoxin
MSIKVGDTLPQGSFQFMGEDGPKAISVDELTKGRRVVIFGLPGAFTGTCSTLHVPSFMRTKPAFDAKGIDEIICLSVNDVHVMKIWAEQTGGAAAGITFLADGDGSFAKALGQSFDAPAVGMMNRSKRYSMLVEDGVVSIFNPETTRGCDISGGETLLEQLG